MNFQDEQDRLLQEIEKRRQAAVEAAEWREVESLVKAGVPWKDADEIYRCWREVARLCPNFAEAEHWLKQHRDEASPLA